MSTDQLSQPRTAPPGVDLPPAVRDACDLVGDGAERGDAIARLATDHGGDRERLEAAVLAWYQRMHRLPSDDFLAAEVLRVLEGALRRVPREDGRR